MYRFVRVCHLLSLPLKVLLAVVLYQPFVLALPQGGQVTQGSATIQQVNDTKLNINQSTDRAVINWNSFSIAPQEWVNFQQPSSTSATLNRVTGSTPSSIAGRLTANGQIFLVNPNGIAFLPTAQVDVAGLVASTLNIKDSDFMQGILRFEQVPGKPPASVVNQGLITVKEAGFAALVAPAVQNSGVISARLGKVVLASGTTVSLDFYGDGLLSVTVDPKLAGEITDIYGNKLSSLIDNQGNIFAPGGIVTLTAQAAGQVVNNVINTGGIIEAKYAENRNGVIILSGGSKGTVAVNGTLDVSGEKGGKVQITGENVGVFGTAKIDASGDKAGGLILVGGDYLGGRADKQRIDPSLNAQNTFVSSQSILSADAKISGNGGEVIIWADNFTRFDGKISAIGDNGGFVETSGKNILEIGDTARVDTTGRIGNTGTWLLDPLDLTISGTGTNNNVTGASPFTPIGTGSILRDTTINTALATNNVVVKTVGTTGSDRGDIVFNNNANVNWSTNKTFTVQAAGQIFMNDGTKVISTNTGSFNAITFEANLADAVTGNMIGIVLQKGSELSTQGGKISLTGVGGQTGNFNFGILQNKAVVQSTTGSITYNGTGGKGIDGNYGVYILNPSATTGAKITSTTGAISITGTGRGTGTDNVGIVQELGAQVSTTTGAITYTGTGGIGTNNNYGILIRNNNTSITTTSTGTITLTGVGKGSGTNNYGILQKDGAQVTTANGIITYKGTGAGTAEGIRIELGNNIIGGNSNKSVVLTSLANGITLNDVKIQTKENIIITSPGNVSQNNNGGLFATTAGKGLQLNGAGNYTLTNPDNDIATLAVKNTGNVSYRDTNGFVIGTVGTVNGITTATTKNVTLEAGGAVTQTQTIVTGGLELKGTGAAYTLTNANNDVVTLAATTNNNLSFTDKNAFAIGTVGATNGITATGKNVTLTAGGAVTQTQAITSSGLELKGAGAIYTLTNANNDVVTLAANVGNPLSFTDKNTLTIGTVNTTNGITTSNDNVTIETGGLLTLDKATVIGTGTLSIKSAGVTQNAGGQITGTNLRLLGTGTFNLNNTVNNIALLAADVNGALTYVDTNVMSISTVSGTTGVKTNNNPINISTVNGNLTVVDTTVTNDVDAGTSTVSLTAGGNNIFTNSTNAKISGTGGVTITADRMTLNAGSVINSGTAITKLQPNNAGRLIDLGGADVAATTLGLTAVELNTVTSGTLRVGENNSGNITVSTAITPGGTNTLSLITGGTVSQNAGATITETNLVIKSGGNITLNQNNQITNFAASTTADITLNDLDGLNIDTIDGVNGLTTTPTNVNLKTTGNITQSAGAHIITSGSTTLDSGTGNIILTDANNDFSTIVLTGTNASITDKNALNFGTTTLTNNLTANASGNITQSASLGITGTATFNAGTGNITLTDANNDFSTIVLTGANASITDKNALNFGTTTLTNNLTANASGNITQSASLGIAGLATFNAGTGNITLTDANNDFSTIVLTGANASITDKNALNFGTTTLTNNLTANASGNITQSASLGIAGLATFNAGTGNITLTDANNDFSTIVLTGANASITDKNALNFGTTTLTNNLTANASGNITQSASLGITGLATFNAGTGDIILTDANNDFSTIVLSGANANITDKNALNFGTTTLTNNLTANASGNITQSASLGITGTATFNAGTGDITLTDANNDFSTIVLTGANASITDKNALNFGTTTLTNNLTANASGNITQSASLGITGTATFNAGTGDITLTDANNDFSTIILSGANANITDKNALNFGTTTLTNNLTANASGNITQSASLGITGTATFNAGTGDITLTDANNDFSTIVLTGANASITDKNALNFGTTTLTNNLTANASGNITQSASLGITGTATFNAGTGDITLTDANNDFSTIVLSGANANITDKNALNFGTTTLTNNLTANASGNITQSASLGITGTATFNAGTGDITLTDANNDFSTIVLTGANASITDKNALNFGTTTLTNNLTANASGNITQSASLGITGTATFNAGTGDITLTDANNDFSTIVLTGANASITDKNALNFGTTTLTNNLTANASGNITQSASLGITGTATFNAGTGDITLTDANNDFSTIILSGANANITDKNALNFGTTTLTNNLTANASGNITQSGSLGITGTATFNAGAGDITLTDANNDFSTIVLTGANANITDKNALNFGTTTLTNNLTANASGNITQSASLGITGTATFNAGTGDITLTDANNDFSTIVLTGANASITDKNALNFGTTTLTNNLTANASGNITQSASLGITGTATFNAGTGDITLTDANNDFSTIVLTGANASITDKNALNFGTTTLTNNLTANASGNITQSASLGITGTATFNAGTGDITLTDANNDFSTIILSGANANITDKNALNFGTTTLTNNLTANASGNITQSGSLGITGTATFNAGAGDITLTDANNDFSTIVLTGANANITDKNALNFGTTTLTNNLTANASGNITQSASLGITGTATFNAGTGDITLTDANNDFSTIVLTGANASITDKNALNFGTTTLTNNLTANASGNITQSASLGITGTATFNAGTGDITLTDANNDFSTIILSGANANITDKNALNFGTTTLTNNLTANASGNITQSGSLGITGTATFNAGTGDIILTDANNDFSTIVLSGANANITDKNALNFGTTTLTNNLTANASGNITQSASLGITGLATFNAGTGDITLTDANNDFSTIILSGANANITDKNALNFGTTTLTNNLTANASGNITQSGSLGITGTATFNAGAGDITLTDANNDFSTIILSGANANITDKNALNFGTTTLTNNLTINSGGITSQTGVITANGLALLGSGKYDLQNPSNTIKLIAGNTTNDISFVNSQILTVSKVNPTGITTTGNVFLRALSGDIVLEAVNGQISAKNITLVADSNFINNFGANALVTTGNFLVYATSPAGNVKGWPVLGGSQQFSTTYPQPALFTGNGFLYKVGAPPVPIPPSLFNETTTFTLNFNERQWRDFAEFSEQSALVESLVCTSIATLVNSPANNQNEPLVILNQSVNPLALTQRVFFANDGLPQCQSDNQASK